MNDVQRAGIWTLSIGLALTIAMVLLMLISRMSDPNGVPILPVLILMLGGIAAVIGLVLTTIGVRMNKSLN